MWMRGAPQNTNISLSTKGINIMNTKLQSRILAAVLMLASTSVSLQPSFAASNNVSKTVYATPASSSVDYNTVWNQIYALLKAGNGEEALKIANQAVDTEPNSPVPYVMKAFVMYSSKADCKSILTQLNKAIALKADYSDALYLRGLVFEDMNDLQSAGADFDACIALNNHDLDAINESLSVKCALKDWNGMLSVLSIEFANNQVDGMAYFARAYAEFQLGQTSAAIADFKQAQTMFVAANDTKDAQAVAQILQQLQAV